MMLINMLTGGYTSRMTISNRKKIIENGVSNEGMSTAINCGHIYIHRFLS
jgi:hypothetical protein